MSFGDDIRTIAKTKELEEKISKALRFTAAEERDLIRAQRIAVSVTADGDKSDSIGNNGSGDSTTGTTSDGSTITPPLAPPPKKSDIDNVSNTAADAVADKATDFGILKKGGTKRNDLSQQARGLSQVEGEDVAQGASPGGGGGGGTNSGKGSTRTEGREQADPDNAPTSSRVTDWNNKKSARESEGATADEIRTDKREHFTTELGRHEVGDVGDGKAGPKPRGDASFYSTYQDTLDVVEVLDAVVGVSVDNLLISMEIRFDGRSTIPSIAESDAAGEPAWTSIDDAPTDGTWTEGFWWRYSNTTAPADPASFRTYNSYAKGETKDAIASGGLTAVLEHLKGWARWASGSKFTVSSLDIKNHSDPHNGNIDTSPASGFDAEVSYDYYHQGDTNDERTATYVIDQFDCSTTTPDSGTDVFLDGLSPCSLTSENAPQLLFWPKVDHMMLKYESGKFSGSTFDPDLPLKYAQPTSKIEIKSTYNGKTYTIEPLHDGGFALYSTSDTHALIYNADRTLRFPIQQTFLDYYRPQP